MPDPASRAVITCLGVISPVGSTPEDFWSAVVAGTPGVRRISGFDTSHLPCRVAGIVPEFDARAIVPKEARKGLRVMARTVQLGLCAAQRAMEEGGPQPADLPPERFGVAFGCTLVSSELDDLGAAAATAATPGGVDMAAWGRAGAESIPPLWMLKYLPNMPACHVSIAHNARGPNNTITTGDVASLLAVGESYRGLTRGAADFFLVGGCDSKVNPLGLARHELYDELTGRNDDPATAVRPFAVTRDGTAPGEGAAAFGLERLDHALARHARIYAEVVGFASGFCPRSSDERLAAVIRRALAEAGVKPGEVDHVNAHAGGWVGRDAMEARAIHAVFGPDARTYALKGQVGNLEAAAGVVEILASVMALHHGHVPGTVNHTEPDPACPVRVHTGRPRPLSSPYAVKVGCTGSGQYAALVLRRWGPEA